jgi:hypothetical protein
MLASQSGSEDRFTQRDRNSGYRFQIVANHNQTSPKKILEALYIKIATLVSGEVSWLS